MSRSNNGKKKKNEPMLLTFNAGGDTPQQSPNTKQYERLLHEIRHHLNIN